jgi:hypothetical protein
MSDPHPEQQVVPDQLKPPAQSFFVPVGLPPYYNQIFVQYLTGNQIKMWTDEYPSDHIITWSFGDGSSDQAGTGPAGVTHTYTTKGFYKITARCHRILAERQVMISKVDTVVGGPATGATAGIPGTWTPAGANPPQGLNDIQNGVPVVVTASPTSKWTSNQHMVCAGGTNTWWDGSGWRSGKAP